LSRFPIGGRGGRAGEEASRWRAGALEKGNLVEWHEETKSADKTPRHFGWPRVLVKRALAYAKAFPEEIGRAGETETASVTG
jgi:hypothetical protein